ncbi:hypothetical protein ILYODFUR_033686 [Ilyodon furcidens]|uniref:Uncharacterized protein n=1 Tax=Ilyodon furcidens TaxID=33524 RepID=A0ABV0U1S5_9TELE
MSEFGSQKKSDVGPPVAAGWRAACDGASGGMSVEAHRGGEPVSNGSCSASDAVRKVQNESSCESPTWENTGSESASKSAIPRRSSLIKVGPHFSQEETAQMFMEKYRPLIGF